MLDELANGVFHGLLFQPQARRRFDALVEKLGIIRGEGGLANCSGTVGGFVVVLRGYRVSLFLVGAGLLAKAVYQSIQVLID
ncbi:hypothetical protein, partial [Pseudomonas sp. RGM2987]|uniref:hypothetical protein n=1 Tax=Pseudomonas sp. RGM2987 TaxID=2930090 RepID=UPI001FD691FD